MNTVANELIKIANEINFDKSKLLAFLNRQNTIYPTVKNLLQGKLNDGFIYEFNLDKIEPTKYWVTSFIKTCQQIIQTIPQSIQQKAKNLDDNQWNKIFKANIPQIKKVIDILSHLFTELVSTVKKMDDNKQLDIDFNQWKF